MYRLKEIREKNNLTQAELASILNLNQNTISRYESGERSANQEILIGIADYFNVSIDYLLGRTDNPEISR